MADTVRMVSKTTFANERITVFRPGGPEDGETGVPVVTGDTFETDPQHARELAALGHAVPATGTVDEIPDPPLEPHHQVSASALRADRKKRSEQVTEVMASPGANDRATDVARDLPLTGASLPAASTDTPEAAAVQANRADGAPATTVAAKPSKPATSA